MTQELNDEFLTQIHSEFERAADYVWKAPRLIIHETKLERLKLNEYFPDDPDSAKRRWHLESRKLEDTFPYMIAVGNLFSVTSLYETYLLYIARLVDSNLHQLDSCAGQGSSRIYSFFKSIGINHSALQTYASVDAAVTIRNCLVHCSGILEWSRDKDKLVDLTSRGRYLSPEHRKRRLQLGKDFDEVQVVQSHLGARIQISNDYGHLTCSYFRDHLVLLAEAAHSSIDRRGES